MAWVELISNPLLALASVLTMIILARSSAIAGSAFEELVAAKCPSLRATLMGLSGATLKDDEDMMTGRAAALDHSILEPLPGRDNARFPINEQLQISVWRIRLV